MGEMLKLLKVELFSTVIQTSVRSSYLILNIKIHNCEYELINSDYLKYQIYLLCCAPLKS